MSKFQIYYINMWKCFKSRTTVSLQKLFRRIYKVWIWLSSILSSWVNSYYSMFCGYYVKSKNYIYMFSTTQISHLWYVKYFPCSNDSRLNLADYDSELCVFLNLYEFDHSWRYYLMFWNTFCCFDFNWNGAIVCFVLVNYFQILILLGN